MANILVVQGANMVWLGKREPELYGTTTADELDVIVRDRAAARGAQLDILYTNTEGEAISRIYEAAGNGISGILMNPAGFNFAGYALRDCIHAVSLPYVEVHMTNIERRGTRSVLAPVANGVICGFGINSYTLGLDALLDLVEGGSS